MKAQETAGGTFSTLFMFKRPLQFDWYTPFRHTLFLSHTCIYTHTHTGRSLHLCRTNKFYEDIAFLSNSVIFMICVLWGHWQCEPHYQQSVSLSTLHLAIYKPLLHFFRRRLRTQGNVLWVIWYVEPWLLMFPLGKVIVVHTLVPRAVVWPGMTEG